MPIRINLLAEAQALEELRRRDPVKRATWVGVFLVFLMLLWSSSIQVKTMVARSELKRWETEIAARSNTFQAVLQSKARLDDQTDKLRKLRQLSANRFLSGSALNALEQTTIDDVELVRFHVNQQYDIAEATKPKTNANDIVIPGRPAMITEKITLSLDAKDVGANPGDQINRYKQTLSDNPYFEAVLGKTNEVRLTNFSPPQTGPDNKAFVLFTLECRLPDKTR
jgi:hypothetical protein